MSHPGEPGYFEREMWRAAGHAAVMAAGSPQRMSPAQVADLAADAAVKKERERMSEMLRNRTLFGVIPGLPPRLTALVEDLMFKLADQIAAGMYFDQSSESVPDEPPSDEM